jgi:hypothetical protein
VVPWFCGSEALRLHGSVVLRFRGSAFHFWRHLVSTLRFLLPLFPRLISKTYNVRLGSGEVSHCSHDCPALQIALSYVILLKSQIKGVGYEKGA